MVQDIISTALTGIMPYLAPIILIIGAFTFADQLRELITSAISPGSSKRRRS